MKQKKKKYRFGINMADFCREHEAYIEREAESSGDMQRLLSYHMVKLRCLQHERLVHLIVTALTVIVLMSLLILFQMRKEAVVAVLILVFAVLLIFYFLHYFRLENTVQRLYIIAEKLYKKCGDKKS